MSHEPVDTLNIPLSAMRPFHPIHLLLLSKVVEFETRPQVYISIVIEEAIGSQLAEHLVDIAILNVHFDPLPMSTNRIMIIMTTNGHRPRDLPFIPVDLIGESNLAKEMLRQKSEKFDIYMSPIMPVPGRKVDNPYGAQAIFTIPQSFLDKQISFYLVVRDDSLQANTMHPLPNSVVAHTSIIDDDLQSSLHSVQKKEMFIPFAWEPSSNMYSTLGQIRCTLQLSVHSLQEKQEQEALLPNQRPQFKADRSMEQSFLFQKQPGSQIDLRAPDVGERWELLSKELQQKQDMVHRMLKELDDKNEALRLTGAEIIELRRQIKMLQSENAILRKRLAEEEAVDIQQTVSREVDKMSHEELKAKIVKIAQAYRNERVRNESLDKLLATATEEANKIARLTADFENLKEQKIEQGNKLLAMQNEVDKVRAYRDTIRRQEQVIQKMEGLLQKSVQSTMHTNDSSLEIERLKSENLSLQNQMKNMSKQGSNVVEYEQQRDEIRRLERTIAELQDELQSRRPRSAANEEWSQEKMMLEMRLQKAELRLQAMQEEMDTNAMKYAKEIGYYKSLLAEKQSIIDTLQANFD